MKTLFRVDANGRVGLGHLQRCLSLAAGLRRLGSSSIFLSVLEPAGVERVRAAGMEVLPLRSKQPWSFEDCEEVLAAASEHSCQAIVVDSYHDSEEYLARLRRGGLFVCVIEDLDPGYPFPSQLVVNADAHAESFFYRSAFGDTTFLLGPRYLMLGPEFQERAEPRGSAVAVRNVLVTLGGSDPLNLMPEIVAVLGNLPGDFTLTIVVGPFFKNQPLIQEAISKSRRPVRRIDQPKSLYAVIREADLAITAGGQTLYELAFWGCPAVAIEMADNQASQLEALARTGCVQSAGKASDPGLSARLREQVLSLLNNPAQRARMAQAGRQEVDGQGAVRVAQEVIRGVSVGVGAR